ncbi:unnamed protein product, partial [Effrenium voratum]
CSGGLLPAGSELCPRPCGTRCCCPVGFRASFSACVPCDSVLRDLPVIYLLPADSGRYVFLCMALLALLLTPWPWALLARLGWASALQRAQEEPVLRYLLQQCRQHLVEDWLKRKDGFGDGPVKLQVSSLSGYSQELSFSEKALVVQLRGAASAAFEVPLQRCGLVLGTWLLGPELDFRTLPEVGIPNGAGIVLVSFMKDVHRSLGWEDAFSFFRRTAQSYRALECHHRAEELREEEAPEGWRCDGCDAHFPPGTRLARCEACAVVFCAKCVAPEGV